MGQEIGGLGKEVGVAMKCVKGQKLQLASTVGGVTIYLVLLNSTIILFSVHHCV